MKINRSELLSALKSTQPGLAKREIIQQAAHVMFMGKCIATFNDAISVLYPFSTDFKCSVNGEEFYKVLEGIKEDEIDLSLDGDHIKIDSKKTKAGFSTLVGENEKVENMVEKILTTTSKPKFFRTLPKDFVKGVFLCMFNASKDMTSGVKCCVAVRNDQIFSTDNLRMSRYVMDSKVKDEILIPARDTFDLVKYDVTRYGLSDGWVHFQTEEGVIFNCRTMKGEYPFDRVNVFFKKMSDEIKVPAELKTIMKNAVVLAAGEVDIAKMVEVTIDKGKITCKSEKERGWMIKEVDCRYKGKKLVFYVNPIFMAQVLESATTLALVQGKEHPDKAYFTQDNYQHIIALPTE
jgi:DNA polymerase III sliding clamp (beta) subunit (PCNA family)